MGAGLAEVAVEELIAAVRAAAVADARVLKALAGVADVVPVAEFAEMEIAAAVTWSRQAAASRLGFARDLLEELPDVFEALARGDIDVPKARVLAEGLLVLQTDVCHKVCGQILPLAPALTTGQLRARLAKLILAADPLAAALRHDQKVSERRVLFEPDRDGCANLLGLDLPAAKARAAANTVQALARMSKIMGDGRSMDQLRADTFLDLLTGKSTGGRGGAVEITATLESLARLAETPGDLAGYGPVIADIARQVAAQQQNASWTFAVRDPGTGDIFHGTTRPRPTSSSAGRADPRHDDPTSPPADPTATGTSRPSGGTPVSEGVWKTIARSRQAPSTMDKRVAPSPDASGAALNKDVPAPARADSSAQQAGVRAKPAPEEHHAGRRPTAAMVRLVRARDRTCRAPGCRVPATRCDLDHRHNWAHGGRTEPCNLTPLCRYHHRAKHEGRWRYRRTQRGGYIWQSPCGRIYKVDPEPPP